MEDKKPRAMVSLLLCLILIQISSAASAAPTSSSSSSSSLSIDYYSKSCPRFEQILQQVITDKQITTPTTAGATLRLFLHDCLVTGSDGSILITSTPFNVAERDADINLSLPGDAFDVVVRAKTALELACPSVVSCADILAVAARDLLTMVGGPYYPVLLGRLDGLVSAASSVEGNLPRPAMAADQLISIFARNGFSVREMVALSGAHTVGFSHCKEFSSGIYNYSASMSVDPRYNPRFAAALRNACANYVTVSSLSVVNDVMTPNKFDNQYYVNLPRGLGVLGSDHTLANDPRTRPFVDMYGKDQELFFRDFGNAMQKLSLLGVKVSKKDGEIRRSSQLATLQGIEDISPKVYLWLVGFGVPEALGLPLDLGRLDEP
ncbi:Peroxidase 63-like protein [Drosera capensis]